MLTIGIRIGIRRDLIMENNNTRVSLLVTTDSTVVKGDTTVEFFDKEGYYIGEISIWADGEIWVDTGDRRFKFKTPPEFFQTLYRGKIKKGKTK
jgi:hypothetical protein